MTIFKKGYIEILSFFLFIKFIFNYFFFWKKKKNI